MGCCKCKTGFTEKWTKGTFYLKKDGNGYYSPEPSTACDWHWSYDGATPQNEYQIKTDVLIYRACFKPPFSITGCDCTNADGGQGQTVQQEPGTADEMGLIVKRFKGTWISDSPNCSNIAAEHRIQYMRIFQKNEEYHPYENDHWCGSGDSDCCPGSCNKPWPEKTRGINKISDFIKMIQRYN